MKKVKLPKRITTKQKLIIIMKFKKNLKAITEGEIVSIFSKQNFLRIAIKISAVHGPTITFLSHLLQTNHWTTVPVMKWINEVKEIRNNS